MTDYHVGFNVLFPSEPLHCPKNRLTLDDSLRRRAQWSAGLNPFLRLFVWFGIKGKCDVFELCID